MQILSNKKPLAKFLRIILLSATTLVSVSFTNLAYAKNDPQAKNELITYINSFNSFTADFKQVAKTPKGKVLASTSGQLKALKPDFLFLHTIKNQEYKLWVQGKDVTNYDPFVEQVQKTTIKEDEKIPFQYLLNGNLEDWKTIEVEKVDNCYKIKEPKAKLYSSLNVCVVDGKLTKIVISQKNGNTNTYELSNFQTPTLSANDFKPDYPDNVQVQQEQ